MVKLANKFFRLCDLLTKILERWNSILPNSGQTMFSTLEFCRGLNDVVQTSPPVQYNYAGLSRAPFPLEADLLWVSPKGTKFEEECSSSKASWNVSPTFGDTHAHDTKWSTTFLNRELCQGSSWMVPKSRQGWSVCPWYNTSSDSWEDSDTMSRSLWCSQETGKHCVSLRFSCARS